MLKGSQTLIASVVLFASGAGWLVAHEGGRSSSAFALKPKSIAPPALPTPPEPEDPRESLELQNSDNSDAGLAGGLPDLATPSATPTLPPVPGPQRPTPTPSPTPH